MMNIHDIIQLSTENELILYLKKDSNVDQYKYNVVSILDPTVVINEATNYKKIEPRTSQKGKEVVNKVQIILFPSTDSEEKETNLENDLVQTNHDGEREIGEENNKEYDEEFDNPMNADMKTIN